MAKKQGLGRDFYELLDDNIAENASNNASFIKLSRISPRADQPRKNFDENALQALADSIRVHGVIQPIAVRELFDLSGNYEIIAGERRWRAAKMAGLDEIPAIILTGDDLKIAEMSLIENLQRQDLNPIEEAFAYKVLIERFDLTQEEVARQVGKSRSAIANMLRLLELPDEITSLVEDGKLSMGHARAILGLIKDEDMLPLATAIMEKDLSVRETENAVRKLNTPPSDVIEDDEDSILIQRRIYMKDLEDRARTALGRKVKINETGRKKTVELTFEDDKDLENLLKTLVGQDIFA